MKNEIDKIQEKNLIGQAGSRIQVYIAKNTLGIAKNERL